MLLTTFLEIVTHPLVICALLFLVLLFARKYIIAFIEWSVRQITVISSAFSGKVSIALVRVLILNWYTFVVLFVLWALLLLTGVGKDIADLYVSNLLKYGYWGRLASYFQLFLFTFIMSLSTWIIPFFIYTKNKIDRIHREPAKFYLATKILAFVAMIPFAIVANRFFWFPGSEHVKFLKTVGLNSLFFLIFLVIIVVFKTVKDKLRKKKLPHQITKTLGIQWHTNNQYLRIVTKILLGVLMLTLIAAGIKIDDLHYVVALYIFISSVIVFRLLFYSDESSDNSEEVIKKLVNGMLSKSNKTYSRRLYWILFGFLIAATFYFYLVPSLVAVNPLYILLIVLSFFLVYLKYWRNVFVNRTGAWKCLAFVATLIFIVIPFLSNKHQFRVKLIPLAQEIKDTTTLGDALKQRVKLITNMDSDGSLYIVCAMGGGSRAAYISAAILRKLDSMDAHFWNHTICYSTVSGGSVGTYSYINGKQSGILLKDPEYLKDLYEKNYNASGLYGLLIGDAVETLFGPLATGLKNITTGDSSPLAYHDRNYRIRKEYDYVMQAANLHDGPESYFRTTFYPLYTHSNFPIDSFKTFYHRHVGTVPIHLINSFEVNNGRRTILSPFPARSEALFPNAILPLEDTAYDLDITRKDITYREAVNLSELFPLISAASYIGERKPSQFVDGGYYENYGLTTAMDVYNYLGATDSSISKRIKILLIKNSKQDSHDTLPHLQLLAPLIGAMNAPFTGHANHLYKETQRILGEKFYAIEFDALAGKVPLTRSLTKAHIDSMQNFVDMVPKNLVLNRFLNLEPRKAKIAGYLQAGGRR